MRPGLLAARLLLLLVMMLPAGLTGCAATPNPSSLWVGFMGREVDLTLVAVEPHPY